MKPGLASAPLLAMAFLMHGVGWAGEVSTSIKSQLVRQKIAMLQKMIAAVPADAPGGGAEYQRLATEVRTRLERAQGALQAGDEHLANDEIDQAIRYVALARQAGKQAARASADKSQFMELAASMESLYASFQKRVEGLAPDDPRRDPGRKVLGQVRQMMDQAQHLGEQNVQPASALMLSAQRVLQNGYSQLIGREVDYTPSFTSTAEEYQHELAQNRSYQDLLPLALEQLRPPVEARRAVEELLKYNLSAVEAARDKAARQQYTEALANLRDGTESLKRALVAAGLVLPQ